MDSFVQYEVNCDKLDRYGMFTTLAASVLLRPVISGNLGPECPGNKVDLDQLLLVRYIQLHSFIPSQWEALVKIHLIVMPKLVHFVTCLCTVELRAHILNHRKYGYLPQFFKTKIDPLLLFF